MGTLLRRISVGFERRWCYGYGEGPDKPEFHVCRERSSHPKYTIHKMSRYSFAGFGGKSAYGLIIWRFAQTLREAEAIIAAALEVK